MATTQQAYEQIYAYFHRSGARIAVSVYGGYQYRINREPEGRACAVGCLIPNELYDPAMDNDGSIDENRLVLKVLRKLGFRSNKTLDLLADAQYAHDGSQSVAEFRQELDRIAKEYGLKKPATI